MDETQSALRALFNKALEIKDAEQRAAYVGEACAKDVPMLRKLERLLEAHAKAGDFMGNPEEADNTVEEEAKNGGIPSVIGHYKLLQKIGEGGCGVVYMAEQAEPVRRRVALKVIKPGMDTKLVVARFEAERQALALMDHPNITKVFDAGVTEAGRPYFVMELVRGVKITEYCDEGQFPTERRLALFIQVCQAVQHAHQKGIIHRDLKPSNILVTVNDGVAVPKVIDFGIAKATTGQPLTDKTIFTAFEQFIGTPAYMSPEQAVMTSLDIDTRSDIYSLGVLLYELLTGSTPFDTKELLAAGLDEMRRTIREAEPPRPSTRLSTLSGNELSTTAQRRAVEPPNLISQLQGDLDWIVMKCLEKDRARRYETTNGLARDLERFLNNEPVTARPPSNSYRFRKLVRRNKLVFSAAGAVLAALLFGLGLSTFLFLRERQARQRAVTAETIQRRLRQDAETERQKSKTETQFLKEMLSGVGPSVALGRDTTLLKDILDKTAKRVGKDLTNQPEVEVELRNTLSQTYAELGLHTQAEDVAKEAARIARSQLGERSLYLGSALDVLASAEGYLFKFTLAESHAREALAIRKNLLGPEHVDIAASLRTLGIVLNDMNNLNEAEASFRDALTMQRKLLGNSDSEVAVTLDYLAMLLQRKGLFVEAESMLREAVTIQRKVLGNENLGVADALSHLGVFLMNTGNTAEGEQIFREALAICTKIFGKDNADLSIALNNVAVALTNKAEAESMLREAVALRRKLVGDDDPRLGEEVSNLASLLDRAGKLNEAEDTYREAMAIQRRVKDPKWIDTLSTLAGLLAQNGKRTEAEDLFKQFVDPADEGQAENFSALIARARFFSRIGKWQEAAADLARAIDLHPDMSGPWHSRAAILVQLRDLDGYRHHCRKSLERFGNTADPLTAERISKDCLLLPSSGAKLELIARMADVAVSGSTNHPWGYWYYLCKGLTEYRQSNFAVALDWTQLAAKEAEAKTNWEAVVQGHMVLAMAQHQLNQTIRARETLSKGAEIADQKLAKLESGYLDRPSEPRDWIAAQVLMREARELIEGQSGPSP